MTTTPQLKLRGIFLAGDLPENLTNPVGDIFSNVFSAVSNFSQHLISSFNQNSPPETGDEQIPWFLHGATPGSGERMMRAPGRPSMWLPRSAFEGNPSGYFRSLRGQPNNFVY
ncbi:hypothetical protein E3N88_19596 [Mikania micrantha]|uniref:Uncharacterized protein n=1 Tax=Mikania micrantha TaxID=192012 RepID=A0A5N6NQB3_9ASTR|nr:hypothetical protein E3N88_19596 [Mikania micrantha]